MKSKKALIVWSICVMVVAVLTVVISIAKVMGVSIPDFSIRLCGVVSMLTCTLIVIATVRMYNKEREENEIEKQEE